MGFKAGLLGEQAYPQNTSKIKSCRALETVFEAQGQGCACRIAFISSCLWGQVGQGKKGSETHVHL